MDEIITSIVAGGILALLLWDLRRDRTFRRKSKTPEIKPDPRPMSLFDPPRSDATRFTDKAYDVCECGYACGQMDTQEEIEAHNDRIMRKTSKRKSEDYNT